MHGRRHLRPVHLDGMTIQVSHLRIFPTQTVPPEQGSKFSSAARADRMAPCGAGDLYEGEARAKKHVEKHAGAESVRLVALVPKIEARCAWDTLLGHAPHRSASPHFEGWIGVASRVRSVMVGFLLEIARRWREKAKNFRGAPPRTPRNSPLPKSVYTPATGLTAPHTLLHIHFSL